MKKKLAYALLMSVLLMSVGIPYTFSAVPKLTEAQIKDRLGVVTAKVKQTINIGEHYTEFNGDLQEDILNSYWNLNWSSDQDNLTIYAKEDGKIMQYSRNKNQTDLYRPHPAFFEPHFPTHSRAEALAVAQAFVNQVLAAGETAEFIEINPQESLSETQYYFNGTLLLNGLKSSVSFSISVTTEDLMVQSYYRGDAYSKILGEVPSVKASISQEAAATLLKSKVNMKLQYVLVTDSSEPAPPIPYPIVVRQDSTLVNPAPPSLSQPQMGTKPAAPVPHPVDVGNDSSIVNTPPTPVLPPNPQEEPKPEEMETPQAVLRYLPFIEGNWMVDAKNGTLIDITTLYDNLNSSDSVRGLGAAPTAMEAKDGYQDFLSPVELEGVEKLKDALSKEQLQEKLFAMNEFQLSSAYTLSSYHFYLNQSNGEITAYLNFSTTDNVKQKLFTYKNAEMNAKTGELISFSSSYPYLEDGKYEVKVPKDTAEKNARLFLEKYKGEHSALSDLYDSVVPEKSERSATSYQYTFAHKVNGYFLATNSMRVNVNAQSGAIDGFNQSWTEGVVFDSTEGIIDEAQAVTLYAEAHNTELQYLQLPAAIDPASPLYKPMMTNNYGYIFEYRLAYQYYNASYVYGIDAKTGEILSSKNDGQVALPEYNDIEGHYAENQIRTLARYGIGFSGETFSPEQTMTQREMLIFLLSASASRTELENNVEYLYNQAYSMNILTKEQRNPEAQMNKTDLVKALLNMSGYAKVAKLSDIFVVRMADQDQIPSADYGYVAIAQGLKIIDGDAQGNFNPLQNISRATAAVLYYNFLNR